jgi:hypothetical protein
VHRHGPAGRGELPPTGISEQVRASRPTEKPAKPASAAWARPFATTVLDAGDSRRYLRIAASHAEPRNSYVG